VPYSNNSRPMIPMTRPGASSLKIAMRRSCMFLMPVTPLNLT
jgi:hypothetical protein